MSRGQRSPVAVGFAPRADGRPLRTEWERGAVIRLLQADAAERGHAPTTTAWMRARAAGVGLPCLSVFYRLFGSWKAALAAAGLESTTGWSKAQFIAAVREHVRQHGRPPSPIEWRYADGTTSRRGTHPAATTVAALFGSFAAGVAAAGFEPPRRWRIWTHAQVIEAFLAHAADVGKAPTAHDWARASSSGDRAHPGKATVVRLFGSFRNGVVAAGLEPATRRQPLTHEQAVDAIREYAAEHGHGPTIAAWREPLADGQRRRPSVTTIKALFGSWPAALAAAGVERPRRRLPWAPRSLTPYTPGRRRMADRRGAATGVTLGQFRSPVAPIRMTPVCAACSALGPLRSRPPALEIDASLPVSSG